MKRYVVDASVAVKWLIPEEYSEQALKLLEDGIESELELHAPSLLRLEVANALTKYIERGLMNLKKAMEGFRIFTKIAIITHEAALDSQLLEEALTVATALKMSIYDSVYFVLAKRLDATLITADKKFIEKIEKEINTEHIKDL